MARPIVVPLILATALFMETTDLAALATALPVIAGDLRIDPVALKLALTSYIISLAVFIPASGWAADRFGTRTVFALAIGVFLAGSVLCALSSTLTAFVLARFVQGIGGAIMVPVGRLILLRGRPKSEMVWAHAWLTVPAIIGPILGPLLGGFIATYFHWRWIFFINVPIGLIGSALAFIFIRNAREDVAPPLDVTGFALAGIGLSSLMLGFAATGRHLLPAELAFASTAIGSAVLFAYVYHARRAARPIIDLRLLNIATYRASVIGGALFRVGMGAVPFLLPLMLQVGFGLNALQSGLLSVSMMIGSMLLYILGGRFLRRFGFRRVIIMSSALSAVFIAVHGAFAPTTPHLGIVIILFVGGCARALAFIGMNTLVFADIPSRSMSGAMTLFTVAHQLSLGFGVAFSAFVLEVTQTATGQIGLTAQTFWPAFAAVAVISGSSLLYWIKLSPDAGSELSGHRPLKTMPQRAMSSRAPAE